MEYAGGGKNQEDQNILYSNIPSVRQDAEKIAIKINEKVADLPKKEKLLTVYRKSILTIGLQRLLKDWSKNALILSPERHKGDSFQVVPMMVLPGIETLNPELKATVSLEEEMKASMSVLAEELTTKVPSLKEKKQATISTVKEPPPSTINRK